MIDALLERASSRFVFVVGKGGVGKTTTAGALSLALADQDHITHLVSTDPAHSIGDLFQQQLSSGRPASSRCNNKLTLEEFGARAYADRYFRELKAPLSELIERGTYLDASDAAGFLDLSIPGIDEVMSALRLVELDDSASERIVVDTAPTGHTLRLLEAAQVIESWMSAGRAMADKADVVASALTGQRVRMRAESLLDDWRAVVRRFDTRVLRKASAVVLTRPGEVVAEETRRLIAELKRRGMRIAAVVSVGQTTEPSDYVVEWLGTTTGCDALRAWRSRLQAASVTRNRPRVLGPPSARAAGAQPFIQGLPARFVWLAGKGGVGKSTCAASIALSLADSRNVRLVSTDPAGSLSEVFGQPVGPDPTRIEATLLARQIDAPGEFNRMREQYRTRVNDVFEALGLEHTVQLDRKVIESLWEFAPPGIDEIISLVGIVEDAAEFDTLVIDSAPTGHFLRLLEMPQIALDWVHALMRLLLKYGAVASLDALARDLLAFAKRLRQLQSDLSTPGTTAVFLVTLAEPLVAAETARLSSALASTGVTVAATILNRADAGERSSPASATPGGGAPFTAQSEIELSHASGTEAQRWIRAPNLPGEIVGPTALRSFISQWELIGE